MASGETEKAVADSEEEEDKTPPRKKGNIMVASFLFSCDTRIKRIRPRKSDIQC